DVSDPGAAPRDPRRGVARSVSLAGGSRQAPHLCRPPRGTVSQRFAVFAADGACAVRGRFVRAGSAMNDSQPAPPAVEVRNLSQSFGNRWAVRNASFDVLAGSLHGFVGPNGAGKTTTLKIICTLLEPQAGTVRVFGQDVSLHAREIRRRI